MRSSTRLVDQTTGWLKNVASIAGSVMGPGDGFRDASARYPQLRKTDQNGRVRPGLAVSAKPARLLRQSCRPQSFGTMELGPVAADPVAAKVVDARKRLIGWAPLALPRPLSLPSTSTRSRDREIPQRRSRAPPSFRFARRRIVRRPRVRGSRPIEGPEEPAKTRSRGRHLGE